MERRLCYSCPFLHAHRPLQYIFAFNVQIMCAKEATHLSTFKVLNSSLRNCRRPTPNGNEPWIELSDTWKIPTLIRAKREKGLAEENKSAISCDFLTFPSQTRSKAYCNPAQNSWSDAEKIATPIEFPLRRDLADAYSDRRQFPSSE